MAFKKVNDLDTDTIIALGGTDSKGKKNPSQIQGYFLGSREVPDKKKKSGFGYIHVLQTSKGNIGVWGKTDLDRKLSAVTPGLLVRLTHTGMRNTPNGDMYVYSVEADADNTIDVGLAPNAQEPEQEDTYAVDDNGTQDDDVDNEPPMDEIEYAPPVPAKAPPKASSSTSQSRVRDLLAAKNRTKTA